MALQLLPVKEMGQLFYNNQLTEEICDALESTNEHQHHETPKKLTEDEFVSKFNTYQYLQLNCVALYLNQEMRIITRIFDDTITPPPLI